MLPNNRVHHDNNDILFESEGVVILKSNVYKYKYIYTPIVVICGVSIVLAVFSYIIGFTLNLYTFLYIAACLNILPLILLLLYECRLCGKPLSNEEVKCFYKYFHQHDPVTNKQTSRIMPFII